MKKLLLISLTTLLTNNIDAQCLPAINNETISVSQNTICSGKTTTITIGASLPGIKYSLRDDATNAVVAGPTNGTGAALAFNTGTLTSSKTFNVYAETQPGGNVALDFDGGDDIINTNTYSSATSSLTLEAWIFPRATAYRRIISNYYQFNQTSLGQFTFDTYNPTNNGRGLRFVTVGGTGTTFSVTAANVLTLNSWNHVAGTFANGVMKLYVNGLAVATSTAPFTSLPANTNEITLGMDPYNFAVASFFDGKMDDIRIWNSARTAAEISGNMNNCLIGNEVGLKNYFKLFENSGTKILDIVTNSIGTMSNMTPSTAWTTGNVDCGTATCNFEMTNLITVNVVPNPTITVSNGSICNGNSFTISPSGVSTYTIQGGSSVVSPTTTTTYSVSGTANGCTSSSIITVSVNPVYTPSITIAESVLTGTINTATGGTATASSTYSTNTAATAFDGNTTTTGWGTGTGVPAWLAYDFGAGNSKIVNKYAIYCSSSMIGGWSSNIYDPTAWTFEGYNGSSWVVLDTRTDNTPTQNIWKNYTFVNTTAYQKYRINISASVNMTYVMVTEMQFFSPITNTCTNKIFNSSSNDNLATYQWQLNGNTIGTNTNSVTIPYFYVNDVVTCNLTTTNTCATASNATSNQVILTTGATVNTSSVTICANQTYAVGSNTYNATGTYSASSTNVFGCDSITVVHLTVDPCTGINNLTISSNPMTLFPNPSSSQVTIQTVEDIKAVYIFNTLGDLVQTEKTNTFSVEQLSSGIYMVHVKTEKGINTLRFIRE